MTSRLHALCIDCPEPESLADFWTALMGWERRHDAEFPTILPTDDTGFRIEFVPANDPKTGSNPYHFDLTSESAEDQRDTVSRALAMGARHHDVGQTGDEGHVVLADPQGNEFCVLEPGNAFLADCGFLGALAGDGSQECGYFWSEALGWPLVWDQDEETAIRSPHGGPKITWGGPPLEPKRGKERWHFDLAPPVGTTQDDEVARLVALGATYADIGQGEVDWVVLADPDGHEFCVLTPR